MKNSYRPLHPAPANRQHPPGRIPRWLLLVALAATLLWPAGTEAQLVAAGRSWIPGNETNDRNGEALAVGDFNGDGFDDLAVGVPDETLTESGESSGRVRIHFGSPEGIPSNSPGNQAFTETSIGGVSQAGDRFGAALAAADFDLDGASDLAIGIPGQSVNNLENAGRIAVVYGSVGLGLNLSDVDFFDQRMLTGAPQSGDLFGAALAAGALGDEPHPDLAVGAPGESINSFERAGAVNVLFSNNASGIRAQSDAYLHQNIEGAFGIASPDDRFGASLLIGDATGDGDGDLLVGSPGDLVGLVDGAGAVQVFPGAGSGVEVSSDQVFWTQDVDGVLGTAGEDDQFGSSMALAHFNGDVHLDLAIGVPGESQFGPQDSGAVQILYGTPEGLSAAQNQIFFESLISPEVADFDRFGDALAAGDFDADGIDDLAIGMPLDNVFGTVNSGNVAVLYGSATSLQTAGAQLWNGFTLLSVEAGDELGFSLATGNFSGPGGRDLVIGVPGRATDGGSPQAGGALVVRSQSLFSDGFESGTTEAWSTVSP